MSRQTSEQLAAAPSKKAIGMATLAAFLVAVILLVTAVLPAEYGIDPLGTGKAIGLTNLPKATAAKPAEQPAGTAPAKSNEVEAKIVPVLLPAADGGAPTMKGTFIGQPERYKIDSREFKLKPGEGTEIKYNMKKGA